MCRRWLEEPNQNIAYDIHGMAAYNGEACGTAHYQMRRSHTTWGH